jgi:hypothetical protein
MPRRARDNEDEESNGPVYVWDFTYFGPKGCPNEEFPSPEDFINSLRPIFKKWIFQKEECPTTKKFHFQGRGSLFKKKRFQELCSLLNQCVLRGMDVSESSSNSRDGENFYTVKADSRVAGPWDDKSYRPPPYIPRQFRGKLETLYPWQKTVLDSRLEFTDRVVDIIIDPKGRSGKSTVASLGRLHYDAIDLPPIGDHKELLQIVCDVLMAREQREPGLVFVDCPRSIDQKKLAPYFIAIEQIKKGFVCDTRYHYKEWNFDSPRVWVFVNHEIDTTYLSNDRWKLWGISPAGQLVPYNNFPVGNGFD